MRRLPFPFLSASLVVRAEVLDSPTRRRIFEIIEERPGVSLHTLAHLTRTTWPNVKYHVLRLESAGLVATRVVGRRRVCYVADERPFEIVEARALLAERTARQLAVHLVNHPGDSLPEIVRTSGLSQRVVYYHLKRFREKGLITHSDDALYGGLRPTALLYHALV